MVTRCPGLKAVCSVSVGFNHIDLDACTRHGVIATNTPGVLTDSVADMALCLTLATVRRLSEGERMVRAKQWKGSHLNQLLGHFGIDPLFFGLLVALNLQAAFLSPPVAMAAFYLKGVAPPHVTLGQIFHGMMPFMAIQILAMVLLYAFPQIGMWLPGVLYQ